MERAIELKKIISEIEDRYEPEINKLKLELKRLNDLKNGEVFEYEEELGRLLFDYTNGLAILPDYPGVYLRTTKQVSISDNDAVPMEYWRPSLSVIKEQLKESDYTISIDGIEITDKNTVVIRTK